MFSFPQKYFEMEWPVATPVKAHVVQCPGYHKDVIGYLPSPCTVFWCTCPEELSGLKDSLKKEEIPVTDIGSLSPVLKRRLDFKQSSALSETLHTVSLQEAKRLLAIAQKKTQRLQVLRLNLERGLSTEVQLKIGKECGHVRKKDGLMRYQQIYTFVITGISGKLCLIMYNHVIEMLRSYAITAPVVLESPTVVGKKVQARYIIRTPPIDGGMVTLNRLASLLMNMPEVLRCLVFYDGQTGMELLLKLKEDPWN